MKLKVGDVVTVVDKLTSINSGWAGYDADMCQYQGKQVTIASIDDGCNAYRIQEDNRVWFWVDTMFKEYYEEEKTVNKEVELANEERRKEIKAALNLGEMMRNGYDILNSCEIYDPTEYGMNKIEEKWLEAKLNTSTWGNMSLFEILSKHPNYVPDKGYIVFSNDWNRPVDKKTILSVIDDIFNTSEIIAKEIIFPGNRTYYMIHRSYRLLNDMVNDIETLPQVIINQEMKKVYLEDYQRIKDSLINIQRSSNYVVYENQCYDAAEYKLETAFKNFLGSIHRWVNYYVPQNNCIEIDKDFLDYVKKLPVEIKGLRVGQKLNKVLGKIFKTLGIDSRPEYSKWLARLGDACSPIQFTRHTIISLNRNDYWTMSFGDHWCSCANIDKNHMRESSDEGLYGDGCCSSGTESYMLDPSTVVMYTVDSAYNGRDFELQDKINRCLFHLGERKFIMGRVYPQGTDGEDAVYKQWRETFQKVIADCMGVTNFWKTERDRKSYQYESHGTHYEDYKMDYCNIAGWSYLKNDSDDTASERLIQIGHDPICPSCGEEHTNSDNIQCCNEDEMPCADCGEWHNREDMYEIDGVWYCSDCVSWCDYHERYEHEELQNVENYGYVCDDALMYGDDFYRCECCGEWFYSSNPICTRTYEHIYCCSDCAESDGAHYCTECETWVEGSNWSETSEMCRVCAERSDD